MARGSEHVLVNLEAQTAEFMSSMTAAAQHFDRKMDQMTRDAARATSHLDRMGKAATTLHAGMITLAAGIAGLGIGRVLGGLVETNREFAKLNAQLETVEGSAELAQVQFNRLEKFAATTPFALSQSVSAYVKLKTLGLEPTERAMRSYGDTASAMGKDLEQLIEAVADASTGEFERLKEFGIKASSEGDRVRLTFKGQTTEIGKNAREIQDYLISIGESDFAGSMERQMDTINGALSNLDDSFDRVKRSIGGGGFNDAVNEATRQLSDFLNEMVDSGEAADLGKKLGEALKSTAEAGIEFADAFDQGFIDAIKGSADAVTQLANAIIYLENHEVSQTVGSWIGKGAANISIGLQGGIDALTKAEMQAAATGNPMQPGFQEQLKKAKDELSQSQEIVKGMISRGENQGNFINEYDSRANKRLTELSKIKAQLNSGTEFQGPPVPPVFTASEKVSDKDLKKIESQFQTHLNKLDDMQRQAAQQMALARMDGLDRQLTEEQFKYLNQKDDFEQQLDTLLAMEGLSEDQRMKLKQTANATRELQEQNHFGNMMQIRLDFDQAQADEDERERLRQERADQQLADARLSAYEQLYSGIGDRTLEAFEFQRSLIEAQAEEFRGLLGDDSLIADWMDRQKELLQRQEDLATGDFGDGIRVWFDEFEEKMKSSAEIAHDAMGEVKNAFEDAFSDTLFDAITNEAKGLEDIFKGLGRSILRTATDAAAQFAINSLFGGLGGVFGELFGGARAMGGDVSAGKYYLVGEDGPELFAPDSAGSITPNNRLVKSPSNFGGAGIVDPADQSVSIAGGSSVVQHVTIQNPTFGTPNDYQGFMRRVAQQEVANGSTSAMMSDYANGHEIRDLIRNPE